MKKVGLCMHFKFALLFLMLLFQVKLFHMQVKGLTDGYQQLGKELLPDYSFM